MVGVSSDAPTPDAPTPDAPTPHAPTPHASTPDAPTPREEDSDPGGMDHRRERIRIETERHRIVGELTLARDGYRSRVSDVLNAPERDFLTLTDVSIEPLSGGPVELHPFLTVARRHIVFAVAAGGEQ
jgi:hypothetical protein